MLQLPPQRFFLFLGILTSTQPEQNVPWHHGFSWSTSWPADNGSTALSNVAWPRTVPSRRAPVAHSGALEQVLLLPSSGDREHLIRNQCLVNHSSGSVDKGHVFHLRTNEASTFLPLHTLPVYERHLQHLLSTPIFLLGVLSVTISLICQASHARHLGCIM